MHKCHDRKKDPKRGERQIDINCNIGEFINKAKMHYFNQTVKNYILALSLSDQLNNEL